MLSKRRQNTLGMITVETCALLVIIASALTVESMIKDRTMPANQMYSLYGDIHFSGKVVGFHRVQHQGLPTVAVMCIKIDSSNVDSFYHFDKHTALKISNGTATLPLGIVSQLYDDIAYVSVNEAGSHKMLFITSANDTISRQLYYTSEYLSEADLSICDS